MPWCGWMTVSEPDWRLPIAIPRAEVSGPAVAEWSMDQPTTRRLKCVEHDCAVDLAFSGWMLGHVGHPQLVRLMADEVPVDQICWGIWRSVSPPFGTSAPAQAQPRRLVS